MYWLWLATSALVCSWLYWRLKNRRLLTLGKKFPGPTPWPILGNAWQFMCNSEELVKVLNDLTTVYGDVMAFWLGPDLNVVIRDPEELRILLSSSKSCAKGPQYKYMANVLGEGILSGSGPTWRRHRKIATPNYGKRAIESYSSVFNEEAEFLMENLKTSVRIGTQFDIYTYIVKTTSYSVCRTLMGLTREETLSLPHLQNLINQTPRLYDIVFDRMTKWWLQIDPVFYLTKNNKALNIFKSYTNAFSKTILEHRLDVLESLEEQKKVDLMKSNVDSLANTQLSVIDRFILSKQLNALELSNETFTIFTSSQEASAKITSFLLLMMAYHPHCQEKLYAEIQAVVGDDDRDLTDEDFKQMPYLDMVFKEILRLFPIGAMLQRTILEDFKLNSCTLPAGCSVLVPIYHLQRDPRYWARPEDFHPERFAADEVKKRHPYCYIPFSLGPMDCLGRHFGTKLVKTICVKVLKEYRVTSNQSYKDLRISIAISATSINSFCLILNKRH